MIKKQFLRWSEAASLASFLFGFNIVVISGWGTVIGAIFGGIPMTGFARSKNLILVGVLYFATATAWVDAEDAYAGFHKLMAPDQGSGLSWMDESAAPAQPAILQLAQSRYIKKGQTIDMGDSRAKYEMTLKGRSEDRLWYLGESFDMDPAYIADRAQRAWGRYRSAEKWDEAFLDAVQLSFLEGADINKVDQAGQTWLHIAVVSGYPKSVKYLLEQGADREIQDLSRMTPYALAKNTDQKQVVNLFKSIPPPTAKGTEPPPPSYTDTDFDFNSFSSIRDDEFSNISLDFLKLSEPVQSVISPPTIEPEFSDSTSRYAGNEIWDGTEFTKCWSQVNLLTKSLPTETELRVVSPGRDAAWIEGGATGWDERNHLSWTFEARIQFNDIPKGFVFWLGTDTNRVIVEVYKDQIMDKWGGTFRVMHNMMDGQFHLIRIVHDAENGKYHVWRDQARLTPIGGVVYDETASDSRLILGDPAGPGFWDNFDVTIDYIRYDQTGMYLPVESDKVEK